ncbi:hypothetical protein ACKKBF_B21640 [Auxenochlorella protothecoides x Auxenochlorella symbiontica]
MGGEKQIWAAGASCAPRCSIYRASPHAPRQAAAAIQERREHGQKGAVQWGTLKRLAWLMDMPPYHPPALQESGQRIVEHTVATPQVAGGLRFCAGR